MTARIPINTIEALGTNDDMRSADDAAALSIYIEALTEGVTVPPIAICQVGEKRFLIDGRHRLRAHQQLGLTTIAVQVFPLMLTPSIALIMAF
ncbi:MAG: ParB/RepB/Spo0J family partition protein, partial [Actinomycetota bacterium]